jgi:hypothetical protein
MKISSNEVFQRASNVVFKDVDGIVYILDPKTNTIHTLNETASYLWRALYKPHTIPELVKLLSGVFEVHAKEAERDIHSFIAHYKEIKFVLAKNCKKKSF